MIRGWTKIFAANGSEVADVEGDDECRTNIRGKIIEVPFGDSDYLTLKLHTDHDGSLFMAEFLILEEGYSGLNTPVFETLARSQ